MLKMTAMMRRTRMVMMEMVIIRFVAILEAGLVKWYKGRDKLPAFVPCPATS